MKVSDEIKITELKMMFSPPPEDYNPDEWTALYYQQPKGEYDEKE